MNPDREAIPQWARLQVWPIFRLYVVVSALLHLMWEFAHVRLYALWNESTATDILYSVLHCTVGDVMIATSALATAVVLAGWRGWPERHFRKASVATIAIGFSYTWFSEWYNLTIRQSWAYNELMPLMPGTEIGLSPLAQWLAVPTIALAVAYRRHSLSNTQPIKSDRSDSRRNLS